MSLLPFHCSNRLLLLPPKKGKKNKGKLYVRGKGHQTHPAPNSTSAPRLDSVIEACLPQIFPCLDDAAIEKLDTLELLVRLIPTSNYSNAAQSYALNFSSCALINSPLSS